ncbi:MAG: hypothetical protein COA53_08220 [Rhodobacteraceae bacterium]|nr:MAG: hypothetical protein COA53_08220 [Paracoccaceae bacterium]
MTIDIEPTDTDFNVGYRRYRQNNTGFFARITDAWKDMPASTRRLIAERPSEARLLFFVLLSDLIFFLSFSIKTVVSPTSIAQSALPDDVALLLVVALMLRTGAIYAFSFILGLVLRAFGGTGTLKDTRAGVFWGSFVSAPFEVLAAILTVSMASMENTLPFLSGETLSLAPLWLGLLPYIWFVSAGATAAHGFKKFYPLFATLSLLCIVGMFWALYLRANGVI